MSLIIKRSVKGSPLTSSEVDANVNNLNNDKVELANSIFTGTPSLVDNLIPLSGTVLPAIYPTLNLDFANSQTLDPRITFARSSTATYIDKYGLVKLAPANVPRFDFDPITKKCLGLLIEEGRTNLLVNSTIDGANLATQNITTTAATRTLSFYGSGSVALSGRVNLLTKTEDFSDATAWNYLVSSAKVDYQTISFTGNGYFGVFGFSTISGSSYTYSIEVKAGTKAGTIKLVDANNSSPNSTVTLNSTWQKLTFTYSPTNPVYFSLNNFDGNSGTVLVRNADLRPTSQASLLPAYQRVNTTTDFDSMLIATIVGLGAYPTRTTYTYTPTAGTLTVTVSGTVQYANDELGSFATSFMPTGGTSFSRVADVTYLAGVNFSSWYNQAEGSFFVAYNGGRESVQATFGRILGSGYVGTSGAFISSNGYKNNITSYNGAVSTGLTLANADFWDVGGKAAMSYSSVSTILAGNGTSTTNNTLPTWSTKSPSILGIGCSPHLNGHISKILYYPKALSSSELVGLTR